MTGVHVSIKAAGKLWRFGPGDGLTGDAQVGLSGLLHDGPVATKSKLW